MWHVGVAKDGYIDNEYVNKKTRAKTLCMHAQSGNRWIDFNQILHIDGQECEISSIPSRASR